jgi:predicted RNase H-like nuclease (RuvC/YqgF family)
MKTQDFTDIDLSSSSRGADIPAASIKSSVQVSQGRAEIDSRVEQARQQMLELRRQQEQLERERQELEDLRRREEEFEKGKTEMLEELSRTTVAIEKEEFEINKRASQLKGFRETFQDHSRKLSDIHESEWTGDELKGQLTKSIAVVEAARAELNRGRAQLALDGEGPVKSQAQSATVSTVVTKTVEGPFDFKQEFQRGVARYLPLAIFAVIIFVLMQIFHS